MRTYALPVATLLGLLTLTSCAMPGVVSNPNCGFPQSVTETHTKTTLVAPPSYSTPYLPPAAIYQTAPVQAPMPMAAPQCPQVMYQAPQPVYQAAPCQPVQAYRADPCQPVQYQAYQADPCAQYQAGYVRQPYSYYAQPHATVTTSTNVVPLGAPQTAPLKADRCEESK